MRLANLVAVGLATVGGLAYAAGVSSQQWDWYLGWPDLPFAQGMVEYGWPTTFLTCSRYPDSSTVMREWQLRNLFVNTALCAVLSIAVASIVFQLVRSLFANCGRPRFSLATLFLVTVSVAATFPLQRLPLLVSRLGTNRWSFSIAECAISRELGQLITVGLFCLAFCAARAGVTVAGKWQRRVGPGTQRQEKKGQRQRRGSEGSSGGRYSTSGAPR